MKFGSLAKRRAALSTAFSLSGDFSVTDCKAITAYMRGIKKQDGTPIRYDTTWDPAPLLRVIESWPPNEQLSTLRLTDKLVTLLAMAIIGRGADLAALSTVVQQTKDGVLLTNVCVLKQQHKGFVKLHMPIRFNRKRPRLCPVTTLTVYMDRVSTWRNSSRNSSRQLILCNNPPHRPMGAQRIAKKIGALMKLAGVPSHYKPGSIRHAVSTAMIDAGIPVEEVVALGRWSSKAVIRKFYLRSRLRTNFLEVISSC